MKKQILRLIYIIGLFIIPLYSYGLTSVIDIAAITQLGNQLVQLEQQSKLIASELKKLNASQYQWSNAQSLINDLGNVINQANTLSYSASNIDEQFRKAYPGYQSPRNYSKEYQHNSEMALNTINGVLQSAGLSAKEFENENTRLKFLQQQSENAEGQTQAIQASTQIASAMVSQIQLLRQTVIAQTNAEAAYFARQIQTHTSSKVELHEVLSAGSTYVPPYGSSGEPLNPPYDD